VREETHAGSSRRRIVESERLETIVTAFGSFNPRDVDRELAATLGTDPRLVQDERRSRTNGILCSAEA
jgi:hypothetical protein